MVGLRVVEGTLMYILVVFLESSLIDLSVSALIVTRLFVVEIYSLVADLFDL